MASLIVPNQAKLNWVTAQTDDLSTLTDCVLRLFKAALSIDRDTTLAELEAVQADYPGYAPIPLENWTGAVVVDSEAITEPDDVVFSATADDTQHIYGCYATNGAGDKLRFASRFEGDLPTPFATELRVAIQFAVDSIFNS